jgi:hypothetical protein
MSITKSYLLMHDLQFAHSSFAHCSFPKNYIIQRKIYLNLYQCNLSKFPSFLLCFPPYPAILTYPRFFVLFRYIFPPPLHPQRSFASLSPSTYFFHTVISLSLDCMMTCLPLLSPSHDNITAYPPPPYRSSRSKQE